MRLSPSERLQRLADLAVELGANVQPGQVVGVTAVLGHEEMVRAIARSAYQRGARYVDPNYFDYHVKHARIAYAAEDTLDWVPPWFGARMLAHEELDAARISLTGPTAPGLFDDVDPKRAGRDQLPFIKEIPEVIDRQRMNWTVVPCPSPAWAQLVYPELPVDEAVEALWQALEHVCRLDTPDPIAAWRERAAQLEHNAATLTGLRLDRLHFVGPGTDLTVGMLPTSSWHAAGETTKSGIRHLANLPTEEVFATPDPLRTHGVVRSTKPLVNGGAVIRDLVVRFEQGRVVQIEASSGADVLRGRVDLDEGARRLGEVALVDRESRIGKLDTVFYETLLDENAACHIALGGGFPFGVAEADRERVNRSGIHIDFMIGADDVAVTGVTQDGREVPLLRGGAWQI
jgi:aminopeptidase